MCLDKFIIHQSVLCVILFYKKVVKWCIVKKEISLNVGQPNNFELICAMQGDNKTFEITATLYDVNKLYTINTNNIKIHGINPVGLKIEENINTHTTNTITFTLTEKMLMYDGLLRLVIIFTDNGQLTTFPFVVKVIDSPGNATADDVKTASDLIEEAKKWADLSKSYAVGTDNVVRPNDKTDNSKYYYELSQKSAEDAKKYLEQAMGSADDFSYYYEKIKSIIENNSLNANIVYYDTFAEFEADLGAGKIPPETLICIKENKTFFSVKIIKGDNMTWDSESGAELQNDVIGEIIPVVYIAKNGYYFPTNYAVPEVNGIIVTRNDSDRITVTGTPTTDVNLSLKAPNKFYTVSVTKGANMTWDSSSGKETQSDNMGAITPIVYNANTRYYFPDDYNVTSVNGISVTRNSDTRITVSGTPTNDTEIVLKPAIIQKGTQSPPTGLSDGKEEINNTTSSMEYASSPNASSWTPCKDGSTDVPAGTWYVRYKETDDLWASDSVAIVITVYNVETDIPFKPGTFVILGSSEVMSMNSNSSTMYSSDGCKTWKYLQNREFLPPTGSFAYYVQDFCFYNGEYYILDMDVEDYSMNSLKNSATLYYSNTLKKWKPLYTFTNIKKDLYRHLHLFCDKDIMCVVSESP